MEEKYNNFKKQEFPQFIIDGISDVITQYIMEHDVKDKNVILRFSKFAEFVVKSLQNGMIEAHNEKLNNEEYVQNFLADRKLLIKKNYDLYEQLEHLSAFNIPDYAIDSIVKGVIEITEEDISEIEGRDFYCLFGENIILDIRNYMQMEQIQKNKN
jgi:hypothetical protein